MMIKLSFTHVQTLTSGLQMAAALSEIVECVIWKQSCHMQEKAHWHASLICDKDKRGMYLCFSSYFILQAEIEFLKWGLHNSQRGDLLVKEPYVAVTSSSYADILVYDCHSFTNFLAMSIELVVF